MRDSIYKLSRGILNIKRQTASGRTDGFCWSLGSGSRGAISHPSEVLCRCTRCSADLPAGPRGPLPVKTAPFWGFGAKKVTTGPPSLGSQSLVQKSCIGSSWSDRSVGQDFYLKCVFKRDLSDICSDIFLKDLRKLPFYLGLNSCWQRGCCA